MPARASRPTTLPQRSEYAFRDGRLSWRWSDLRVPRTLDAMRGHLEDAHGTLRGYVDGLADADLQVPRQTNWGELWPTERIVWVVIQHDGYHGGQIRTMRAFYRARTAASSSRV